MITGALQWVRARCFEKEDDEKNTYAHTQTHTDTQLLKNITYCVVLGHWNWAFETLFMCWCVDKFLSCTSNSNERLVMSGLNYILSSRCSRDDGSGNLQFMFTTLKTIKLFNAFFFFFSHSDYASFIRVCSQGPLSVFVGRAAKNNLVLIFPQICRWEEWSPAPSALAQWLCWHGPKLNIPHPFSQGHGSVIHYEQNPTSHSSQTFTPLLPSSHRWHAPWKEDCGDKRMTLSISSTFPIIPISFFF